MEKRDVYSLVTDRILALLEQGTVPWHKPWRGARNLVSNREYRGINALLLGVQPCNSPYWLTMKEANALGGHIKKSERSSLVVFWKWDATTEIDPDTGEKTTQRRALLRYYLVFNLEQTEGVRIPRRPQAPAPDPIDAAQTIVDGMPHPPTLRHLGSGAYYDPLADVVNLPPLATFESSEEYYSTAFHELVHSTGHQSRCARGIESNAGFGGSSYAKEELVAELGAAFLCTRAGIETRTVDNSAAYLQGWLRALRNDRRRVVLAASAAQRAADYILTEQRQDQPTA